MREDPALEGWDAPYPTNLFFFVVLFSASPPTEGKHVCHTTITFGGRTCFKHQAVGGISCRGAAAELARLLTP